MNNLPIPIFKYHDRKKRWCLYCRKKAAAIRHPIKPLDYDLILPCLLLCGLPIFFLYAVWWGFGRPWYCTACGNLGDRYDPATQLK